MRILCPHNPKDRMILVEGQEYIIDLGSRPGRGGWGTIAVYMGNNTFRKSRSKWDPPDSPQQYVDSSIYSASRQTISPKVL